MAYGSIKVDTIVFTNNSVDQTVSVSGIIASTSGNLTVTGTISGTIVQGTYGSFTSLTGVTTSGTNANFQTITGATGVFTTSISGATGTFTSLTGITATFTSGIIASGTAALPSLAVLSDPNTGLFSPGADQLAISTNGTGRLFVSSGGAVGIGTAPGSFGLLDVLSDSSAFAVNIRGRSADNLSYIGFSSNNAATNYASIGTPAVNTLGFDTNGSERLRITSAGLVGIGTTGPVAKLHVAAGANVALQLDADTGLNTNIALSENGSIKWYFGNIGADDSFRFYDNTAATERLRIDSSGRLLVGTSSALPVYYDGASTWQGQLQVARSDQNAVANFSIWSSAASTYTTYGGVQLHLSACRSGTVGTHTSGALTSGDTIGSITFDASDGTNFRNSARIEAVVDGGVSTGDVPGRLVFSTTADGAASPTERMRITNSGQISAFSQDIGLILASNYAASSSNNLLMGRNSATAVNGGTDCIFIRSNGNIQNTNNSYGAISDAKLKENIVDATSQWDDIKALQVRKYNFKEGQTHTQIGLVAQEVELVSPGLVGESPDSDNEGNDLGTVTKSVNYSVLYMKAVKALQEAMERIETLEASNADILARLSALEAA